MERAIQRLPAETKKNVNLFLAELLVRAKHGEDPDVLRRDFSKGLTNDEKHYANSLLGAKGLHKELPGSYSNYLTHDKIHKLLARYFPSNHGESLVDYEEHEPVMPAQSGLVLNANAPEFSPAEYHAHHHLQHNMSHR